MPRSSSRGAAVATLLVAACCLVGVALMQSHRGPVEEVSIKAEEGEYKKVAAKNAWLEKQDHQLKSQEKRAEEQLVERRKTMVVTRLNTELAREEKSNHFLRRRDARLTVDNQQLKLMFLKEKVMLRKARINAMDEKLKTGDLASDPAVENRIIMSMRSKQHRQLPGVRAKKATAAVLKTAAKTQQLEEEEVSIS
ncbi:hypothetical protein T484DRAFT_1834732 [Baffinella frigidus]|nr:hypothetical protein T484DRAFT_1834732 [Cryptophyta sp. CCMP2293]